MEKPEMEELKDLEIEGIRVHVSEAHGDDYAKFLRHVAKAVERDGNLVQSSAVYEAWIEASHAIELAARILELSREIGT